MTNEIATALTDSNIAVFFSIFGLIGGMSAMALIFGIRGD